MTIEDDVRTALRASAGASRVDAPAGWDEVARRGVAARRRRTAATGLGAVAVLVGAAMLGIGTFRSGGERDVNTVAPPETSITTEAEGTSTSADEPTSTTAARTCNPCAGDVGIWPFATDESVGRYRASGAHEYDDAGDTALAFARTYLGMSAPQVETIATLGVDCAAPPAGGCPAPTEVRIRPNPRAGPITSVLVWDVGGAWTVGGAVASSISRPTVQQHDGDHADSRLLVIEGEGRAFEGTINIAIRDEAAGEPGAVLGEDFVTAGGGAEMEAFQRKVAHRPPRGASGALVLFEASAEDGSTLAATVVRLDFR